MASLNDVETINELREWVNENLPNSRVTEDSAGNIVIHTNLTTSMGGYLHANTGNQMCGDCLRPLQECQHGQEGEI